MSHAALIDQLGGPAAVGRELGLSQPTVSCWKTRDISWEQRPKVAALAKRKKVKLPADFWD